MTETTDNDFTPEDEVEHPKYGHGTVKEHPDGRDGTFVFFRELKITTIMKVQPNNLEKVENEAS